MAVGMSPEQAAMQWSVPETQNKALNEKGKYHSEYGHPEKSQQMLMHVHHVGKKIPYSAITKFNYGYRR
jgi:hypothetical protein